MKSTLCILLCFTSSVCLAEDGPPQERAIWEQKIKKVHVGMRRAEVEKLLPHYVAPTTKTPGIVPYSCVFTNIQGGSQAVAYYVSPRWRVGVPYDYTGTSQNAKGAGDRRSPDNRVIGDVTLEYFPEPSAFRAAPKKQ